MSFTLYTCFTFCNKLKCNCFCGVLVLNPTLLFVYSTDYSSSISLKIKGHKLFFLLDKLEGAFIQPTLFDNTVGLKRAL